MKTILLIAFFAFFAPETLPAPSDAIVGTWLTEIEDGKVEIFKKGTKYFGKVVWIAEPNDEDGKPLVDKENPDPAKRNFPVLGLVTLTNLVYDNDGEWDGKVYDPKNGETYTCKLWIDKGNLKVRGYLGWLFDTKTWTRVK